MKKYFIVKFYKLAKIEERKVDLCQSELSEKTKQYLGKSGKKRSVDSFRGY